MAAIAHVVVIEVEAPIESAGKRHRVLCHRVWAVECELARHALEATEKRVHKQQVTGHVTR
jgi:hypothetical protein